MIGRRDTPIYFLQVETAYFLQYAFLDISNVFNVQCSNMWFEYQLFRIIRTTSSFKWRQTIDDVSLFSLLLYYYFLETVLFNFGYTELLALYLNGKTVASHIWIHNKYETKTCWGWISYLANKFLVYLVFSFFNIKRALISRKISLLLTVCQSVSKKKLFKMKSYEVIHIKFHNNECTLILPSDKDLLLIIKKDFKYIYIFYML